MTETLDGRHIVVTGGTGALGGAVVGKLLDQGAICHVPNAHAAAPPHFPFAAHDRVRLAHNVDLSDSAKVEAFYHQLPDLWGSIHLAGGFAMAPVEKIESASFAEMMDTNARTTFLCCRAAIRSMLTSGTAGRIVNVTARAGLDPRRGSGMVAYAASKAAVAAMTVAMAEELKHKGILVN
ncbi:MAG: SDR family NAD(P)-dependent oxidoreductase, partial [Mesorhizobium sp.]